MNISKDTWHYRNYSAWLNRSTGKKAERLKDRMAYNPEFDVEEYYRCLDRGEDYPVPSYINVPGRRLDFCTYFWAAVLRGPLARWGEQLFGILLATAVYFTVVMLSFGLMESIGWDISNLNIFLVGPVIILGIVGAMFVTLAFVVNLVRNLRNLRAGDSNIFLEKYRASKRGSKVCPFVEFED